MSKNLNFSEKDYSEIIEMALSDHIPFSTIRKLYGTNIQCNAVHGSDSIKNAEIEIKFFFSELELVT